jgi:hypothetical protein
MKTTRSNNLLASLLNIYPPSKKEIISLIIGQRDKNFTLSLAAMGSFS